MCSPSAPAQQTVSSTELPDWAKPYAKDVLAKGQALTDVNQNPYQQYTQPRVAGFSPMQQQAMQNAQGMTVTPQTEQATAGATLAGLGGMGVAGQANPFGFQNQVGGYMNPYLQMSLAPQLAEANRQYDIGATRQQSAATQAGAFGGSREAIMAAENERNRNTGLNQIIGQGYNTAFNQAQNQYNQNLQNQLAGFGLTNQAASNLGQLGQNQYGQQMGINQLQNQYGTAQQNLAQTGLNNAYQEFLNQQNYPYKQLGFMSDMIRGLPLGQQSTSAIYQGPPTALQTVGALGLGAYGVNQLSKMADGGEVKTYAGDQGSVTSDGNTASIIAKLSPQQLQQAKQTALARRDMQTVEAIDERLAELASEASMTRGIAGAMPQDMADGVVSAAGGGILAFKEDGLTPRTELSEGESGSTDPMQALSEAMYSRGDPAAYRGALKNLTGVSQRIRDYAPTTYTPEQQAAMNEMFFKQEQTQAGPSPYGSLEKDQGVREEDRKKAIELGKGALALRGMKALLKGTSLVRGLGELGGEVGEGVMQLQEADRREKRSIADMDFKIKNAQRQERMGFTKSAQALTASAIADKKAANKAGLDKLAAEAKVEEGIAKAAKQTGKAPGTGGGSAKEFQFATDTYLPMVQANEKYKDLPLAQQKAIAYNMYQTNRPGVTAGATVKSYEDASKAFNKMQLLDRKGWKQRVETEYGGDAKKAREDWIAQDRGTALPNPVDAMLSGKSSVQAKAEPQQNKSASNPKVIKLD